MVTQAILARLMQVFTSLSAQHLRREYMVESAANLTALTDETPAKVLTPVAVQCPKNIRKTKVGETEEYAPLRLVPSSCIPASDASLGYNRPGAGNPLSPSDHLSRGSFFSRSIEITA
jgi:hypothetical protein